MEKGNKAVAEGVSEDKYEGKKYEAPSITVFEFSDDKIQHIRFFTTNCLSLNKWRCNTQESQSGSRKDW